MSDASVSETPPIETPKRKRSDEPIFWSLFGAGGVVAALALPGLVLVTGIAGPFGLLSRGALGYERVSGFAGSLLGSLMLLAVISLTLWHAAHRIFHSLHDFGVTGNRETWKRVCYGTAMAGTVWAALMLALLRL